MRRRGAGRLTPDFTASTHERTFGIILRQDAVVGERRQPVDVDTR
jgi:hypothetical protein